MSWSIKIDNAEMGEAMHVVEAAAAPRAVKDYVLAGVGALMARHGERARVSVDAHGHLHVHEVAGSHDVTTATIAVKLSQDKPDGTPDDSPPTEGADAKE